MGLWAFGFRVLGLGYGWCRILCSLDHVVLVFIISTSTGTSYCQSEWPTWTVVEGKVTVGEDSGAVLSHK